MTLGKQKKKNRFLDDWLAKKLGPRNCITVSHISPHFPSVENLNTNFVTFDLEYIIQVWVRLMLPGVVKRIYNVQSKQLVKIFSRITGASEEDMLEDLEAGDVAETVTKFFESSEKVSPASKATLSVHDVDEFLDKVRYLFNTCMTLLHGWADKT